MAELQMIEERPARRTREELQLLAVREVLRATAAALPLDDILTIIANMTIIVFDATTSWFMLPENGSLRTTAVRGEFADKLSSSACHRDESPCYAAASGERPQVLQPWEIDPGDPVLGPLAAQDESVVLVPLRAAGQSLGLLGVAASPEAALDVSFLVTVANQAATAVQSAHQRAELRTWRQRLDTVFARIAEPVLVSDSESRLALWNTAAEQVLGAKGVRLGDSIAELAAKMSLTGAQGRPVALQETAAARALRGERVDNLEETLLTGEGALRYLLVSAAPLQADGRIEGAVEVWRDITHIRELERMRAEFLSAVSHELRSPLTSVLGFAQLLQRKLEAAAPPQEIEKGLQVIIDQSRRVDAMVEDLLDASRAEVGRLPLNLQSVDLAGLVQKTVADSRVTAPDHTFHVEIPDTVPTIRADPSRVEQVLRNLLSNAVKYSAPGTEVTVRVTVEGDQVVVAVQDQGVGIAPEDIPSMFMPFYRVRQARGRETAGVGLGLFISRAIAEAHGGRMGLESELGKGSTFYFRLPATHRTGEREAKGPKQ